MKFCGRCFLEKPLSEFNKDKYSKSGYRSQCKDCMKAERKRLKSYYREWRSRPDVKEKYRQYRKERAKAEPNKMWARNKARKLKRPDTCERCGCTCFVEAHHDDYARPLDVTWLCRKCHLKWHEENGEGANP